MHAQRVDERSNLTIAIDCYMVQNGDQQVTIGPLADKVKTCCGGDTRWEWRAETEVIYSRCPIDAAARQAHPGDLLVVEVAHYTAIRLYLGYQVDGAADLDQFSGAVTGPDKIERHTIARRFPKGRCRTHQ